MGNHHTSGWDFELDEQYDDIDCVPETAKPFSLGLATPFTGSDLAIQFFTRNHGTLWIPKKGIHNNSEVWKPGQSEGELVVHGWCAKKKGLL